MEKLKYLLLFVFLPLCCITGKAFEVDGIEYAITTPSGSTDYTVSVMSRTGKYSGSVTIPPSVKFGNVTYRVTGIGNQAFYMCSSLTEINLPTSIVFIDDEAFYGCNGLSVVEIPNGITNIGGSAFYGCENIKSLSIGENVSSLGASAFCNCLSLEHIDFNAKAINDLIQEYNIFYRAGENSPNGITVNFNEGVISIPDNLFNDSHFQAPNITGVCISSTVTSIGKRAFGSFATKLKTVINNSSLPLTDHTSQYSGLTYYAKKIYSEGSFSYLNKDYRFVYSGGNYYLDNYNGCATELTLPSDYNGHEYIVGDAVFWGNSSIEVITIPNTITSIGNKAFTECPNLSSVTIGTNVTSIGEYAFYTGECLSKVYLLPTEMPSGIDNAFSAKSYDFLWDKGYYIDTFVSFVPNSNYTSTHIGTKYEYVNIGSKFTVDGIIYVPITSSTCDAIDFDYANKPKNISINNNVIYRNRNLSINCIRDHFMEGNDSLLIVNITNSGSIGSYAFSKCLNLKQANLTTSSILGDNIFNGCTNLSEVILPETITSIPSGMFNGCTALRAFSIPASVTSIGLQAFKLSGIENVVLPSGVKTIYSSAFEGSKLAEIQLPSSLLSIGSSAFKGTALSTVVLPSKLRYLYNSAFENCLSLSEISLPKLLTDLYADTFKGCKSLKSFIIPANINSIMCGCFSDCTALTDLQIEDSDNILTINRNSSSSSIYGFFPNVKNVYIGRSIANKYNYDKAAFDNNTNLKEVIIGDKVKTLPNNMFRGCTKLEKVSIGNQLQAITVNMFESCTKLTSINLPPTVTSIGSNAFKNCTLLKTFDIPTRVIEIGDNAFYGCTSFEYFNIPEGVSTIAKDTFTGCSSLKVLTIVDAKEPLTFNCKVSSLPIDSIYVGRVLNYTNSPFKGSTTLKSLKLGDSCTEIGDNFVAGCTNLSNIYTNDKLVKLGVSSFQNCSSAKKIMLPETLASIGDYSLAGCSQIEDVNISDNISVVPDNVVSGYISLRNFKIPAKVCDVSASLFSTCSNLQTVIIVDSSTPLSIIGDSTLFANTKIDSIYIGRDLTADKAPLYNSKTIRNVVFGNKVKSLQANYFYGCNNLENLTLPQALTSIGSNAFYGCSKLTKISLPKSVTSVGTNAFDGCSALKYAEIESGQGDLAFNADFDDCALDSIYIGRNLTGNAIPVKGKTSIKSYKTGAYVTSIPENALSGCSSLTDLWIGKAVETLGKNALLNCTSIETIKSFNTAAPVCASGVLSNIDKWGTTLYVPTSSVSIYEGADQWKDFFFIEGMDIVNNTIVTQPTSNSPLVGMSHPNTGERYQWFIMSSTDVWPIMGAMTSCLTSQQVSIGETVFCEITLPGGEILRSNSVKITGFATYKTITFMADGAVYFSEKLPAGATITLPEAPVKNGYTFVRWDNLPETMPNNDIVVTAIFTANKYTLTYIVDGEQYKSLEIECDAPIVPESAPDKPGKTFVEWSGMQSTMPANNLTVTAVYIDNTCVVYNGNSTRINASYISLNEKPAIATADNALVFVDMPLDDAAGSNFVMKNDIDKWQANSIVLTDAQPFYSPYEIAADNVTYTRNFKADSWQPLYVPYDMSYDDWAPYADIAELACVHVYEDGRTTIEFVTVTGGSLRPNTPYMVKPKALGQVTISSLNKMLKPTPEDGVNYISCSSPRYEFKLYGNFQPISGSDLATLGDAEFGGAYIMAANNKFAHAKSTSTLTAFRLYFTREKNSHGYWNAPARQYMPEPEYLDEIYLMVDGELCGVIDPMNDTEDNSPIYDLLGRPVDNPERGMIYIQNGQKFIKQ